MMMETRGNSLGVEIRERVVHLSISFTSSTEKTKYGNLPRCSGGHFARFSNFALHTERVRDIQHAQQSVIAGRDGWHHGLHPLGVRPRFEAALASADPFALANLTLLRSSHPAVSDNPPMFPFGGFRGIQPLAHVVSFNRSRCLALHTYSPMIHLGSVCSVWGLTHCWATMRGLCGESREPVPSQILPQWRIEDTQGIHELGRCVPYLVYLSLWYHRMVTQTLCHDIYLLACIS